MVMACYRVGAQCTAVHAWEILKEVTIIFKWLRRRRRAERSYSTFKVRKGGHEEIPLVQGKEWWLCFAGAAMKRYPTSKVRETQEDKSNPL